MWPLLLIPGVICLFAASLWAGPEVKRRRWRLEAVCRRYAGESAQLDAVYGDTLKLLALHGFAVQPKETLVTFPNRVDEVIAFDDAALSEIAGILMRSHFKGQTPEADEIARACLYHERLETLTLEQLGRVRYLFKRVFRV